MKHLSALWRSEGGASAAEFALVLPATLLLFFGVIDGGRYLWAINRLEKAVQMGARTAVVTKVVAEGLNTADFVGFECPNSDGLGTTPLRPGDAICKEAVPTIECSKSGDTVSCLCSDAGIDFDCNVVNADAFDRILARMRVVDASIGDDEVAITYSGSGIGYADDPSSADAAPIVTVSVDRPQMRALLLLGGSIPLPNFTYSQTLEDGDGSVSY